MRRDPEDSVVGILSATDPNGDDLSYRILENTDPDGNGREAFRVVGNRLLLNDPGDLSAENWWRTAKGRARIFTELGKIGEYALKGDLGDV